MHTKLLLLSNSTNPGEPYLSWPKSHIKDFLGNEVKKILFIPYAGVTVSFDEYFAHFSGPAAELGYTAESIHTMEQIPDLNLYDAIAVGGGNTFRLASLIQKHRLTEPIRKAVSGGMPYIGWSAGSNFACPSIMTTNDMPIVEPTSFSGLNLIPFQINPHYTEAVIPNHGGESRDMRILEFVEINRDIYVAGLPEGSLLRQEGSKLTFVGRGQCKLFHYGKSVQTFHDGDDLSWLIH